MRSDFVSEDNEFQKKKRYLARYRKKKRLINRLEDKLFEMDASFHSLKGSALSPAKTSGGVAQTIDDRYSQIEDLEERINRLLSASRKLRVEIYNILDKLDNDKEIEVLELYFIEDKSILDISTQTNYSYRYVMKLYGDGVRAVMLPEK